VQLPESTKISYRLTIWLIDCSWDGHTLQGWFSATGLQLIQEIRKTKNQPEDRWFWSDLEKRTNKFPASE